MLQKLDKLLATEIISLSVVLTAGISSIMIMTKLPRFAELLFSSSDVLTTLMMLLLYIFPSIIKYTVPVSLLLSCSIVTMRMSSDRELEAWMASGVNLVRLSFMPSLIGVAVMIVSLFSAFFFEPYSNKQFDKFRWLQTRSLIEAFLKSALRERSFIYDFPASENTKLSFYFSEISEDKTNFKNVFLAFTPLLSTDSSVVVAQRGSLNKILVEGYPDYVFTLKEGSSYFFQANQNSLEFLIKENPAGYFLEGQNASKQKKLSFLYPAPQDWSCTTFSRMDISLVNTMRSKFKLESNMQNNADELYPLAYLHMLEQEKSKNPGWQLDEAVISKILFFLKQLSTPLSTVFLPVIGMCLGVLDPRKKQFSVYLGTSIVIFLLYASISLCQQLILKFIINPYCILFVTPLLFTVLIWLLLRWRLRHPPSTGFLSFLYEDFLEKLPFFFATKKG